MSLAKLKLNVKFSFLMSVIRKIIFYIIKGFSELTFSSDGNGLSEIQG